MIGIEDQSGGDVSAETYEAKRLRYLEVLSNFTDETLEGELADEELSRLLVATNFTESDRSGTETMRLLDTTSRGLCDVFEPSYRDNREAVNLQLLSCEQRT